MCLKNEINNYTKKETLEELFRLHEERLYENTDTNRQLARETVKAEEQFYNTLTEQQKEQFEQLCDLKQKNYDETDKNIFIYGFRLATNIAFESIY